MGRRCPEPPLHGCPVSDSHGFRAACVLSTVLLATPGLAVGQSVSSPPVLSIPRLEASARIDGRLDEDAWSAAATVSSFTQREPLVGEPASQPTEVLIFSTADAVYLGARFEDSEADQIVATEYVRDADLDANDAFEIFLDTLDDGRNAFYFATNAVGVQRDGLVRNEGEQLTWEWDGVWYVACTRDERGWTAEVAIPFTTLRFEPGAAWGLNLARRIARTREESYWRPISRDWGFNGKWRVSAFGRAQGVTEDTTPDRLALKPFVLAGREEDREELPGDVDLTAEVGLDAKFSVTPTLVADFTLNTDFAQVEADQEQVNLTRFPLFFPEKREFFLENAGLFQVGERASAFEPPSTLLFFSRRIGLTDDGDQLPLIGGARLTGRVGGYDIGLMDIVSEDTRIDEETRFPRTNFSAMRLKRDVLARSSVGAMYLDKSPAEEGRYNRVIAADANFALRDDLSVIGFAAKSFTPDTAGSAHALFTDVSWQTDRLGLQGSYLDIGDAFESEMGFLQREGIRKYRGRIFMSRRPRRLGVRQIFVRDEHIYVANQQGALESQSNSFGSFLIFDSGATLFAAWNTIGEGLDEPFELRDDVDIPIGTYRFNQGFVFYESDRSRQLSGRVGYTGGGFFDGSLHSVTLSGRIRPHNRLTLEADYVSNRVDVPVPGGTYDANLVIARAVLAFSARAFVRGLIQVNDDDDEARANVVFRYTYRPGADLFVVYNEERSVGLVPSGLTNRQLLLKLTAYTVR